MNQAQRQPLFLSFFFSFLRSFLPSFFLSFVLSLLFLSCGHRALGLPEGFEGQSRPDEEKDKFKFFPHFSSDLSSTPSVNEKLKKLMDLMKMAETFGVSLH